MNTNGQVFQDLFALTMLQNKQGGIFLEIGSNHPININNSYILEKEYNWKGIMIEYDSKYEPLYKKHRTSKYIINDATKIDYKEELKDFDHIDYLQIDLEVTNRSTLTTLENVLKANKLFSCITFEHDIYRGNHHDTRNKSREMLKILGYKLIFADVKYKGNSFEDWYIHPLLVDKKFHNIYYENLEGDIIKGLLKKYL